MNPFFAELQAGNPYAIGVVLSTLLTLSAMGHLLANIRYRKWPFVWGTLKKSGVKTVETSLQPVHTVEVKYSYEVNGVEHTGDRLGKFSPRGKGGAGIRELVGK